MRPSRSAALSLAVVAALAPAAYAQSSRGAARGGARAGSPPGERGVVVRDRRAPAARELRRTTLLREEIRTAPGTGGDALRAVQNLPGVARTPYLAGHLLVRGSDPADTQVFVDGTPVPMLYHYLALTSTIATDALDRIDVYPSNFAARFGRAGGGVVEASLRSPRRDRVHVVANADAIQGGVVVEGPLGRDASFLVAARYGWVGHLLTALGPVLGDPSLSALFGDYQGVLEWRPGARTRVRLALLGSMDTLRLNLAGGALRGGVIQSDVIRDERGYADLAFHLAQLSAVHDFAPGVQARATLSGGWTSLSTNVSGVPIEVRSVPFHARYELSHPLGRAARITWGADVSAGPAEGAITFDVFEPPSFTRRTTRRDFAAFAYQPGLYVEAELTPTPALRVATGLRFDYARATHAASLSPRVNAQWAFAPAWLARAGVGAYDQVPRFDANSALPLEAIAEAAGAARVVNARVLHYGAGVEWSPTDRVSLAVDGFYKTMENVLTVDPIAAMYAARGAGASFVRFDGLGRAYGVEVLLRHRPSERFHGFLAYTLMRAERRDGPDGAWYPWAHDQTHIVTALASVRLGAGWEAGVRFRYVSGRVYTPVAVGVYDADLLQYVPVFGPRNSARAPDFHQLDVRVEKRWRLGRYALTGYLEVLNVYYARNTEFAFPSFDGLTLERTLSLPIIPSVGLRVEL